MIQFTIATTAILDEAAVFRDFGFSHTLDPLSAAIVVIFGVGILSISPHVRINFTASAISCSSSGERAAMRRISTITNEMKKIHPLKVVHGAPLTRHDLQNCCIIGS
jgi:hypothetical protein